MLSYMYAVGTSEAQSQDSNNIMFSKPDDKPSLSYKEYMNTDLNPSISAGLARYRSAPTSFLSALLDGGGGFQELLSSGGCGPYDVEYDPRAVKGEMLAQEQQNSQAGFFSDLTAVENGFARRSKDRIHFSPGQASSSRYMPQIVENENESSNLENGPLGNCNSNNGFYVPSFEDDSWKESSLSGIKRGREDEDKFNGFNAMDNQNGDDTSYSSRLTHHLSLPKMSGGMDSMEKYLQFQQEAVPCKIRAKRGFATHPRSIAERMRRTRISDKMKKLQDLFPDMDKQTNTADMLDLAVEYIKNLQDQVQTLTGKKAKCTCIK